MSHPFVKIIFALLLTFFALVATAPAQSPQEFYAWSAQNQKGTRSFIELRTAAEARALSLAFQQRLVGSYVDLVLQGSAPAAPTSPTGPELGRLFLDSNGVINVRREGGTIDTYLTSADAGVTSITGTANQITASASTGAVTLSLPSVIDVATGFRIGGAAASGKYLRGDGTNFISATISATDITTGTLPDGQLSSNIVTLTGSQALSNKTLTSPIINVGSDATGDVYYRNSGGAFTRLAAGTNGHVLTLASGIPSWAAVSASSISGTDGSAGSPVLKGTDADSGIFWRDSGVSTAISVNATEWFRVDTTATNVFATTAHSGLAITHSGSNPSYYLRITATDTTVLDVTQNYMRIRAGSESIPSFASASAGGDGFFFSSGVKTAVGSTERFWVSSSGTKTSGDHTTTGVLIAGSGPTTLTDSTGKILTAAINAVTDEIWLQGAKLTGTSTADYKDFGFSASAAPTAENNSNTDTAFLAFIDGSIGVVQHTRRLPSTWTGNIDVDLIWSSTATTGDVKWGVACACGTSANPSFNTESTVTTTTNGSASIDTTSSVTSITTTGCAAGEIFYLRVRRIGNDGADTLAADANFRGATLKIRHTF